MFNTASVRSIRCVFAVLSIVLSAALLSACAHLAPPDPGGSSSWVVENVASKSTQELYAGVIAPAVFERSSSKVNDGYTVESGNLRLHNMTVGSMITVRSAGGSLLAAVEKPGKRGWLVVSSKGESRFTPNPAEDYSLPDTLVEKNKPAEKMALKAKVPYVVDVLVGFSRSAVEAGGGDATANALALVEGVNLALRNSQINELSMKLVGVQVIEQNYPIVGDTLDKVPNLFATGIKTYAPDIIFAIFGGHPDDNAGGYGFMPGGSLIGHNSVAVVRHEVGHNAGGHHCPEWGGGITHYSYGYTNGKTSTALCGNEFPYYSTPNVVDSNGLPIGSAETADMARVWRENAERLSSYAHFVPQAPGSFRFVYSSHSSIKFEWSQSPRAVKYEIWGRDNILLPPKKFGESNVTDGVAESVPSGLRPYFVVAVYSDGTRSPNSNIVNAKPYETSSK